MTIWNYEMAGEAQVSCLERPICGKVAISYIAKIEVSSK